MIYFSKITSNPKHLLFLFLLTINGCSSIEYQVHPASILEQNKRLERETVEFSSGRNLSVKNYKILNPKQSKFDIELNEVISKADFPIYLSAIKNNTTVFKPKPWLSTDEIIYIYTLEPLNIEFYLQRNNHFHYSFFSSHSTNFVAFNCETTSLSLFEEQCLFNSGGSKHYTGVYKLPRAEGEIDKKSVASEQDLDSLAMSVLREKIIRGRRLYDDSPLRFINSPVRVTSNFSSEDISILNLPEVLDSKVLITPDGAQIIFEVLDLRYSFTKSYDSLGIPKEYESLIEDYIDVRNYSVLVKHQNEEQRAKISVYDSQRLLAKIQEIESLGFAYLRLTANEENVNVILNGQEVGQISSNPFVGKVKEGKHTLMVRKPYFGTKTIQINVTENEAFAYHFDLIPSGNMDEMMGTGRIIQSTGVLTVLTSRNDVSIFIDGAEKKPPFTLPAVASGKHKLVIKVNGKESIVLAEVLKDKSTVISLDDYDIY
ncbi:PEGA domain-containing protein [uncultured Paraglaciecola sp.]|uniref:PEGA domain-containing protein n=1 Tax=uncultured Paraglaciecola sp. TaxID=1765024 RepID=UPI00261A4716|nr:PEGA domain-containing protein [uncultured Paraglaciecola sp.]